MEVVGAEQDPVPPVPSPVRELFGEANYRNFWVSQVLYSAANGTLRFTFVWLVVTLTEWEGAEGLVAIALGLPATFLSLPAGAWSDRVDRHRLYMVWTAVTAVIMAAFTAMIAMGAATPWWTAIAALAMGATLTVNMPNIQAMVPLLVSQERLMNAVALQNGGSQAASFLGLIGAGLAIRFFGDSAGFGLVTITMLLALWFMYRVELPAEDSADRGRRGKGMIGEMVAGARFGFGTDPVRTLLLLAVMLGGSFSVMQVSMPRVVEDVYEQDSAIAGVILASFGLGMLISSAAIAGRSSMPHGRNVAIFIGVGLGLGQLGVSFAPNAAIAAIVMLLWGLNAGIAMTSHRTLIQTHTPPEMMGRVMGLMMLGFAGSLPIGAFVSFVMAPQLGPQMTMRVVSIITMVTTISLTFRRKILDLR